METLRPHDAQQGGAAPAAAQCRRVPQRGGVFDEFLIGNGLYEIYDKRPDLYLVLCERKWRHWSARISQWRPIRHWQSYVQALNETIRRAGTLTLNIL